MQFGRRTEASAQARLLRPNNGANRVSWNCFPIARHSDNIHFGQGRASRVRFSWEISNQESEHASVRLGFEERQHVIVFQRESADKYRDDASDVERWRETSVFTRADALGAFLALAWTIFRASLKWYTARCAAIGTELQ